MSFSTFLTSKTTTYFVRRSEKMVKTCKNLIPNVGIEPTKNHQAWV